MKSATDSDSPLARNNACKQVVEDAAIQQPLHRLFTNLHRQPRNVIRYGSQYSSLLCFAQYSHKADNPS